MKAIYICQLSKPEKLIMYKRIKKALLDAGCYSLENVRSAFENKIRDVEGLI